MNQQQYRDFWKAAGLAYPRIAQFFAFADLKGEKPLDEEESKTRHDLWKRVIQPLDFDDCQKALDEMLAGRIAGPGYDPSDFPAKIRTQVGEYRAKRAHELASRRQRENLKGNPAAGSRCRIELAIGVRHVKQRAMELFIARRPDIEWPWTYLHKTKAEKTERSDLWKECVQEAMAEFWPEGQDHPTFPVEEIIPIPTHQPLLRGLLS